MKKKFVFFILIILSINLYGIKFFVDLSDDKKLTLQGLFSSGVSQIATTDLYGLTEYQSVFFKFGFHIEDFGFLYDLNIKFRLFAERPVFYEKEWSVPDNSLATFLLYLDKIEYIKYGSDETPIYFKTGVIPYLSFGSGLIVNNYHNRFFLPVAKENGLFFKFDGKNLDKFKTNKIPVDFTFFITDLFDPDIMGLNSSVDIFDFTKINRDFGLKAGYTAIMDLNVNEKNRLSTTDEIINEGNHRNMFSMGYTSCLFINSLFLNFKYKHKYFKINVFN
ncbi:MAG TPA: hypothetical protein PK771_14625, partial [Spirochaetota bacterium]|nr:hypothetical protein [Spirochaetota bacterium]